MSNAGVPRNDPPLPIYASVRFSLSRLAVVWCQKKEFQKWAGVNDAAGARAFILRKCNCTSRRELDRDPAAAKAFHELIRRPFAVELAGLQ